MRKGRENEEIELKALNETREKEKARKEKTEEGKKEWHAPHSKS